MIKLLQICLFLLLSFNVFGQKPEVAVQSGHNSAVVKIAFNKVGTLLASGDTSGAVKLWDLSTSKIVRTIQTYSSVADLAFSIDGKSIVVAAEDCSVIGIDLETGLKTIVIGKDPNKETFSNSAVSLSKSIAAQIKDDGSIKVSNLNDGKELYKYFLPASQNVPEYDYKGVFFNVFFSPRGSFLIGITSDRMALINTTTGKDIWISKAENPDNLVFTSDEKLLAVSEKTDSSNNRSEKYFVTLRSVQTEKILKTIEINTGEVSALSFSPNDMILAGIVKETDKEKDISTFKIKYWSTTDTKLIKEVEIGSFESSFWGFEDLRFRLDSKKLAIAAGDSNEGQIYLYEADSGQEIAQLESQNTPVYSFGYLKNNLIFADTGVWDLKTGRQVKSKFFAEHTISPDGKYSAAYNTFLRSFEISEFETGKFIVKLENKEFDITSNSVAFSPDNRFVISFSNPTFGSNPADKITLFDAKTGTLIHTFPDNSKLAAFSANGKFLAYSTAIDEKTGNYAVKIWDVENFSQVREIKIKLPVLQLSSVYRDTGVYPVSALSFNPQNNDLAIAVSNKEFINEVSFLNSYNIKTGEIRREFGNFGSIESLKFSLDGKLLAFTSSEKIRLLNADTGLEEKVLTGHDSIVHTLDFDPNGTVLASGGSDGQVIFWDYKKGEITGRLILVGESDYLFVTPENYYLASRKGAAAAIAYRIHSTALPFEQFDIRFNRPDLVLKKFGVADKEMIELYAKAYQKRLRQNNLTENDLQVNLELPEVFINTASMPAITKEKLLRFKVKAEDKTNLLSRLNVFVNDVAIYGEKGFVLPDQKTKNVIKDVELELTEGNNRIQVSVFNDKGVESIRKTFNLKYGGNSPKPELYLVGIGVTNYKDIKYNLKYPAEDVDNLVKLFENRAAEKETAKETALVTSPNQTEKTRPVEQPKSFYRIHKLELVNENAVLEKIDGIRNFLKTAKPEDEVIVFISGHGMLDKEKNYYFATHDIDFKNPKKRGLSFKALESLIDDTKARRKILLLDTCHAGEVDKSEIEGLKISIPQADGIVKGLEFTARSDRIDLEPAGLQATSDLTRELFADLRLGSGAITVSASGGLEYAYESPEWSGGVFTYSLLLGLREMEADENEDGQITISELRNYVGKKISELTEGRQKPNTRSESVEFDFRVY